MSFTTHLAEDQGEAGLADVLRRAQVTLLLLLRGLVEGQRVIIASELGKDRHGVGRRLLLLGASLLVGGDASQDSVLVSLEDDWQIRQLL